MENAPNRRYNPTPDPAGPTLLQNHDLRASRPAGLSHKGTPTAAAAAIDQFLATSGLNHDDQASALAAAQLGLVRRVIAASGGGV